MLTLLTKLWRDDAGALLAAEWMFVTVLLTLGLITGFTAVRQAVVSEMTELGNAFEVMTDPTSPLMCSSASTPADDNAVINQGPCD
jgi:Flp pilus assembly pilin Flp